MSQKLLYESDICTMVQHMRCKAVSERVRAEILIQGKYVPCIIEDQMGAAECKPLLVLPDKKCITLMSIKVCLSSCDIIPELGNHAFIEKQEPLFIPLACYPYPPLTPFYVKDVDTQRLRDTGSCGVDEKKKDMVA